MKLPVYLSLLCLALIVSGHSRTVLVEGKDSIWKYWTGEAALPAGWNTLEFDDQGWTSGPAPLGIEEKRATTALKPAEHGGAPAVALFRKSFTLPKLERGERVVVSLCVDDGALVLINGRELNRFNLPDGAVTPETKAKKELSDQEEGFYTRWTVPIELLKVEGSNVVAVQVQQAGRRSSDLFFDLSIRTVAPRGENPKPSPAVLETINAYYKAQHVPPGMSIPDGYIDGGRNMRFDVEGRASSNREIIVVDRTRDEDLKKHIEFARGAALQKLAPRERAVQVAMYVDKVATPPGGSQWTERANTQLTDEFTNQPVLVGEILDQCHAGVCRHRGLLFKILADEAGLKTALRRGNLRNRHYPQGYPHAWNEVYLEGDVRVLVDSSYRAGKWDFPDVNASFIVEEYRKLDNSPLYGADAK